MPVYAIRYEHPDATGWATHLMPHVNWLQDHLADGTLLASGPFPGHANKAAMLLMTAPNRAAIEALIATDPFAQEGLIANLLIEEWDPIFGAFNALSSMPGQMQVK